ncbi:autotransporter outer membrane beta-barrel domain-containing protein [Parvularcula dongshanensis]|uniref:Uncharacterized protein YhjY with autotransporter beta-barrel domain n=1 Tax=Parvularcula dongshanensis TaxID=1173995 RepID=A0A840I306_9PROT|nr:autotransporter outer membrane beta-barrel domain-containing protein [Parvularcula dongshanensis]MBB4658430.1 uncharacterized protein YhjY with autotransporter beta-barrel domain [Parvularcula dongshanensis]
MTQTANRRRLRLALLSGAASGLMAASAVAQTEIANERTTPIATSAAGDVTVTEGGSITVPSGTALTIDSDADVVMDGTIDVSGEAVGARGVLITGAQAGSYTQAGDITIQSAVETVRNQAPAVFPADRYGLLLTEDAALTGDVSLGSGSSISVESAGGAAVSLEGTLTGSFSNAGALRAAGEDASALRIGGTVTGDVTLSAGSTFQAAGIGATGLDLSGSVGGGVVIGGTIGSSAFTTQGSGTGDAAPIDQTALASGDGVRITGSVAGGVTTAAATSTTNAAVLVANGSGRALYVGDGAEIGAPAADGYGIVNGGTIAGDGRVVTSGGSFSPVLGTDARAVVIGDAVVEGGFRNAGGITATTNGLDVGSVALDLGSGAELSRVSNAGTISATATTDTGQAVAVRNASPTLSRFVNTGTISASVSDYVDTNDTTGADDGALTARQAIAIDFRASPTGIELINDGSTTTAGAIRGDVLLGAGADRFTVTTGSVSGLIDLGDGDDVLALSGGSTVTSPALRFGAGNDTLTLLNSRFIGNADFGGGTADTLSIAGTAGFAGTLTGAQNLSVDVRDGGELSLVGAAPAQVQSLTSDGGTLLFSVAGEGSTFSSLSASGDITLSDDTVIATRFASAFDGDLTTTILRAGGAFNADIAALREGTVSSNAFLFDQDIALTEDGQGIDLTLRRKGAAEVGIGDAFAPAYPAVISALAAAGSTDPQLGAAVFNIGTFERRRGETVLTPQEQFSEAFSQFLPAPLDGPLTYARAQNASVTSIVTQRVEALRQGGARQRTAWLQEETLFVNRDADEGSLGFDGGGFVVALGADMPFGPIDVVGVSASIASGRFDEKSGEDFPFDQLTYAGSVYAADVLGPIAIDGRVAYGMTKTESERTVQIVTDEQGNTLNRSVIADWDGTQLSAYGRVRYEGRAGAWNIEPFASVDYLKLDEDGYAEEGPQGAVIALTADDRSATSLRGNLGVTVGRRFDLRPSSYDTSIPGIIEPRLTVAWSQELDEDDLTATYRFGEGDPFTLTQQKEDGAAILGGDIAYQNEYAKLSVGVSATVGDVTEVYTLRAGVGLRW